MRVVGPVGRPVERTARYCPRVLAATRTVSRSSVGLDWWTALLLALTAWTMAKTLPAVVVSDTFFDLNCGRLIAEHGIPRLDTLTVVAGGREWVDQQWLAHLAFHGAEAVGGLTAVALLADLVWLAALTVLVVDLRKRGLAGLQAATIGFVAVVSTSGVATARAQVFSLLLFAIVLVLLNRAVDRPRLAWWCVPMLVVWANVHGSVVVGVGLVGAWALTGLERGRMAERLPLLAIAAMTLLCTPYGFETLTYLRDVGSNDAIRELISEWRAPRLDDPASAPFFALLASTAIAAGVMWRRITSFEWLTVVPLAGASLFSQRFVGFFAFAAAHLLGRVWSAANTQERPVPRALRLLPHAVAAVALGTVVHAFTATDGFERRARLPEGAARALALVAGRAEARVLADEQTSNYVLWKEPRLAGRVALDSRLELLSEQEIRDFAAFLSGRAWRRYASAYDALVIEPSVHPALAAAVRRDRDWRVLADTEHALVVDRRPERR